MNALQPLYPEWLVMLCGLFSLICLFLCVRQENWRTLPQPAITGWLASSLAVLLMWQLQAEVQAGIPFHLLGSAALALIAGPARAMLALASILLLQAAFGHTDWSTLPVQFLIFGATPVLLVSGFQRWSLRHLPRNIFIYLFVNAFAASALATWAAGLLQCLALGAGARYTWGFVSEEILPYYFLMGWPEAFTTGLNLTLLVVWLPDWVCTFDDRKYLLK